jgi:hypothetical protein
VEDETWPGSSVSNLMFKAQTILTFRIKQVGRELMNYKMILVIGF